MSGLFLLLGCDGAIASPMISNVTSLDASNFDLVRRANFQFDCYAPSQACRGIGATEHGGSSNGLGCLAISSQSCTRYSFNGGGAFKLCLYAGNSYTGAVVESVNGGSVTCLQLQAYQVRSFNVIAVDGDC